MLLHNRLLITGTPRSGKSSLIRSLSDRPPKVSNLFQNSSSSQDAVMLDYGEIFLDEDRKLELYATPGQRRFHFIWSSLLRYSMGLFILVDHRRPHPLDDLNIYLDNFTPLISTMPVVIGLNYHTVPGGPSLESYSHFLKSRALYIPVIPFDPRSPNDCFYLLSVLLSASSFSTHHI